jgi:predicted transglutaminase-like cysteine proteinase
MFNLTNILLLLFLLLSSLDAKDLYTIDDKIVQKAKREYGPLAKERLLELVKLLNRLSTKSSSEQLESVNDFFNKVEFKSDMKVWKQRDYWASREEFLDIDEGDCEDYVIAKYFTLLQLGFSEKQIFLTYVKAIKYKQSHMVLTYYKKRGEVPLVLDNIVKEILPSTKRRDLRPVFSFNGEKIYMAKQRGLGREVPKGKVNLKKWTNLILKIKREKI